MRKSFFLIFALLSIRAIVHAQSGKKIALSVGPDVFFPSQNTIGPGFTARVELPLAARLKFTFSTGLVTNFFDKRLYDTALIYLPCDACIVDGPANDGPAEFVPFKAGLRYYLGNMYVEGMVGEALKANLTINSFIYGGALGGLIPFNNHNALDIGFGYERGYKFTGFDKAANEVAIRLAYRYQF